MNTIIKKCEDHVLMNTPVLHLGLGVVLHPTGLCLLICLFTINVLPVECKYFFEGGFLLFKLGPRWPPRSVGADHFLITPLVDKEKREMRAMWYMDNCGLRMRPLGPSHCTCEWEGKRWLIHEIWLRRWW